MCSAVEPESVTPKVYVMSVPAAAYVVGEADTLTLMAEVGGVTLFDGAEAALVPSPLVAVTVKL